MKLLSIVPVAALAMACGGSKEATPAAPVAPQEFAVHAVEYAFHGADTIHAGLTKITLTNGGKELHHTQLVRLDSGKTVADLQEALKKPGAFPAWAAFVPATGAGDPGGGTASMTIDLPAGNYALLCLVDIPGGVPHFAKGMIKPLTVTASTTPSAPAPTADITVALSDFAFAPDKPLTAGKHVFKVTSTGAQPHEIVVLKLAPGKTMDDVGKWMQKPVGPPPATSFGGTSALLPGSTPTFEVDFTPGDYVFVCFIPDAKDGKMHVEKGMVMPFKIQ